LLVFSKLKHFPNQENSILAGRTALISATSQMRETLCEILNSNTMKELIVIILLITNFVYGQQKIAVNMDSTVYRFKTCKEGKKEARVDFQKGNYNSVSYGLSVSFDSNFEDFLAT